MSVYAIAHSGLFKEVTITTHPHAEAARQFLEAQADKAGLIVVGEEDLKQVSGPCLVNLYNCLVAEGEPTIKKFDTKPNGMKRTFTLLDNKFRAQEQEPFNPVETAPAVKDNEPAANNGPLEGASTEEGQMAATKKTKKKATKKPAKEKKARVVAPLFSDLPAGNKPTADMTCGAYIRSLIMTGKFTTEQMLEKVGTHYKGSKAKGSDISWNRQKLRAAGKKVPEVKAA